MNLTKNDYQVLKDCVGILSNKRDILSDNEVNIVILANSVLLDLHEKQLKMNEKSKNYIAEKRKIDKNYARGKK